MNCGSTSRSSSYSNNFDTHTPTSPKSRSSMSLSRNSSMHHSHHHLPWSSGSKLVLIALVTLTVYTVLVAGYLGPRYGKRLPYGGEVSRIVGRSSSGPRAIQSRSQARFYAGSRYGGKRSYWPSLPGGVDVMDSVPTSSSSYSPYDCVYVPYLGVRCAILRSENGGGVGDDENEHDRQEMSPGGGGGGQTRTSIIEEPVPGLSPSNGGTGSE